MATTKGKAALAGAAQQTRLSQNNSTDPLRGWHQLAAKAKSHAERQKRNRKRGRQ